MPSAPAPTAAGATLRAKRPGPGTKAGRQQRQTPASRTETARAVFAMAKNALGPTCLDVSDLKPKTPKAAGAVRQGLHNQKYTIHDFKMCRLCRSQRGFGHASD